MRSSAIRWFVLFCSLFSPVCCYAASAGAATATTLSVTGASGPVTTLSGGGVVVLTAAVQASAVGVTQGQVRFCEGAASVCAGTHLLGVAQLTSAGSAIFRYQPSAGVHTYKAVFAGTHTYANSTSASSQLTVTGGQFASTTSFTTTGNGPYNLSATVTGLGTLATGTPTGSVSIVDTSANNAVLASSALSAGIAGVSFTPVGSPNTVSAFNSIAAGDFNNDGKQDVVVGKYQNNQASLQFLSGNGDGTLTAGATTVTNLTSVVYAKAADFNQDGRLDLAVIYLVNGHSSNMTIFLGGGDGTFTAMPQPVMSDPSALCFSPANCTVGDFDGDGIPDLAAVDPAANAIDLFIGVGDGTFTPRQGPSGAAYPQAIARGGPLVTGDFNGDGNADLAVLIPPSTGMSSYQSYCYAFAGNGDGSFQPASSNSLYTLDLEDVYTMTVGDFKADGVDEIVYTGDLRYAGIGNILFYSLDVTNPLTRGSDGGEAGINYNDLGTIAVGDFNGDGNLDAVTSAGLLALGSGTSPLSFQVTHSPSNASGLTSTDSYLASDFNGDGLTDLVSPFLSVPPIDLAADTYTATATVNPLNVIGSGVHQIKASYSGDSIYTASSYTAGLNAVATTTLTLSAAPSFSTFGQQVVLTAMLSPASAAGHSTDGETISFSTPTNAQLGSAPLMGGAATLNLTSLPLGTSSIQAAFAGDGVLQQSTSNLVSYTVYTAPTLALTIPAQTYGAAPFAVSATSNSSGAITYSVVNGPATLSGSTLAITAAGTVTVQASQAASGGYAVATKTASFIVAQAPLTVTAANSVRVYGAPNPTFSGTLAGAVNGDTLSEVFATNATVASQVGSYVITPSAVGAALSNYVVRPSNGTLTISQAGSATSFTLTGNTLIANVVALSSGTPSGTVIFLSNQSSLGTAPLVMGTASLTLSTPPGGAVTLTAQYSGEANFTQSSSASLPLLAVTPANSALTAATSGTVTDVVTIGTPPGYSGTVQLACTGLPANSTCSSAPVTFPTSSPNITLTLTTGTAQAAFVSRQEDILAATLCAPTLLLLVFLRKGKQFSSLVLPLLMLALAITLFTACGGGGNKGPTSTTSPNPNATPAGSYTVTLNATGTNAAAFTQTIALKVQ